MEKTILILMDLLVIGALGVTMIFMRRVYGSIKVIREGKTELQQLLQQLNVHISNAQHSIDNMNKLADEKAKTIQKQIENATAAIDELQFIQRAADNVAQRLEKVTGDAATNRTDAAAAQAKQQVRPMSKAEKELADAMAARRAKAAGE
jgi:hypothetical protein